MKMKKFVSGIMIVILVFIFGCANDTKDKTKTIAGESPYIGGDKGLLSEFEQMGIFNEVSKEEEIFENESFPIEVILRNKGEYEINPNEVRVYLMGINVADFENIPNQEITNNLTIEKITEFNTDGGEVTLDFTPGDNDALYKITLPGSSYDVSVFARVTYRYKTFSSVPKVCFKENLKDTSVCEIDEEKVVYSSGAPIKITKATEKRAGTGKISVEFDIENVANGQVTTPGDAFDSRYDKFKFLPSDASLWDCRASGKEGEARFDTNGNAKIVCKLANPMDPDTLYTKQLDLTLEYDYRDIIHKQIRILKQ